MTTWTQSYRLGLRPSRTEVWALRIAERIERSVDGRMLRRADRDTRAARRAVALEDRRQAAVSAFRGLHL